MDAALYREVLPLLDSPRKEGDTVLSYCPVHADGAKHGKGGSGRGGRSLQLHPEKGLRCASHSCDFKDILAALRARSGGGESQRRQQQQGPRTPRGEAKEAYEYRDAQTGDLVAVKARFEWPDPSRPKGYDKSMQWRLPDGTYQQGLGGLAMSDMPLYRGEAVAMAEMDEPIWWVEGEAAVHALERQGKIATTSGGGSGVTAFTRDQLRILYDRDVIIWPDNDDPGRKYARAIADSLREIARRVVIWEPKGTNRSDDAVDFLAAGRSLDEFEWPLADALGPLECGSDKTVSAMRTVGYFQIHYRATNVRRERTGIHAVVSIRTRGGLLASSNFNVERDEDRVRLANSAHSQLAEPIAQSYPKAELKRDLDRFCTELWDAYAGNVDIGEMGGDPDAPEPVMLCGPYVIEGGGTILFGEPGKGKSTIAQILATSIHHGVNLLWDVEQRPVMYVNLERSKISMERRQARVNELLGLDPRSKIHFANARGRTLFEIYDAIDKYVRRYGIQVGILDSISRAGVGDLNDNLAGNRVIDAMNGLFPTWLAIGHTARGDDTHVFGSQMQDAGMDLGVQLVSSRSSNGRLGVGLQITKANDTPKGPQEVWSLGYDRGGLVDLRRAKDGEFGEIEDRADRPSDEKIAIALRGGALPIQEISDRTGISFDAVKKALYRYSDRFVEVEKGKRGFPGKWGLAAGPGSQQQPERSESWVCRCGSEAVGYNDSGQPVCSEHMAA